MIFLTIKDFQKAVENKIEAIGFREIDTSLIKDAIDLYNINNPSDLEDSVDCFDELEWFSEDITYYSKAIEYLANNDPSLSESIGLASELGYDIDDVNSELLASLLATENNLQEWWENKDEIYNDFTSCEVLEDDLGIDFDDWIGGNQEVFKQVFDKMNDEDKDWFNCLTDNTSNMIYIFINQDGLNEPEVLDKCDWVTQERLDNDDEVNYSELDIEDLLNLAETYKFSIME